MNDTIMSNKMVATYIDKFNSGSSPAIDCIMAEHLKHALSSNIIRHVSVMFSLCLKSGIVVNASQSLLVSLGKNNYFAPCFTTVTACHCIIYLIEAF
jgi:hypothetical protein